MTIKAGDKIKVEYTGTFDDGTVFDASEKHGKPLEFEVGAQQVVKGFDHAVIGMKVDEEKEFKIEPEQGYGPVRAELVKKVPRSEIPTEQKIEKGMVLGMQMPNGAQMPIRVTDADEESVTLDMNHPMAGKTLNFKIKILGIEEIKE